ncbi:alpha/beta hydrolase family protein [Microbacterium sp. No. 7]|uniref:alpha/beta hydrolase family protein n=1 Tax=Microbacterium sp. No. 7 TaxID=1714373 RepID=UPI0006D29EB8|nr:alpha/beta fold hydrolase [Microbacterium sp. No. 7]ALJ20424.1 alpha/beta hydrolase [Microbacterium sp. No. 7]
MNQPRRADTGGALLSLGALVRVAATILSGALAAVTTALGLVAVRMARKVVTPATRVADTRILDVDVAAQTITLSRSADTVLPGRYGLFTSGTADYLKLGSVLRSDGTSVTRKLLTQVSSDTRLSAASTFSGWYYERPEELHLPFSAELVASAVGPCPAWLFPADSDTWVIQIHGRGAQRRECLRAVPVFHAAGITSLIVSYRNDGEAPRSRSGMYGLGSTEWRDVDAAIGRARKAGAKRILLMGWSMGGAIALQVALRSAHRDLIAGVVLESPVIDWRIVLDYNARLLGLPAPVSRLAIAVLGSEWATPLTGLDHAIPFGALDIVARAGELRQPVLILHSDDDGFVPSDSSHDLVVARPDLVEFQVFDTARHTKLWNYDQDRWVEVIAQWLERHALAPARSTVER